MVFTVCGSAQNYLKRTNCVHNVPEKNDLMCSVGKHYIGPVSPVGQLRKKCLPHGSVRVRILPCGRQSRFTLDRVD